MMTLDKDVATALRALSPGNKTLGRTASLLIREALVRREEIAWLRATAPALFDEALCLETQPPGTEAGQMVTGR
jgi:hypothetical protein